MKLGGNDMRKCRNIIWALLIIFCLTACEKENTSEDLLYDKGLEVVSLLDEMAKNEDYLNLFTMQPDIKNIVKDIAAGDYTQPESIYKIDIPLENIDSLYAEVVQSDEMSEGLKRAIERKMRGAVITQIYALGGAVQLAASSILNAGKQFVCEGLETDLMYLYIYEDSAPVAVYFTVDEDYTVYASGNYLTYKDLTTNSTEEIVTLFENMGAIVTEITGGQ